MGKYKLLLSGKNNTVIDDFFNHLTDSFDCITTSTRFDDMVGHLKVFRPDVFVYCMNDETRDDLARIKEFDRMITREDIQTVIIGTDEECDNFQKIAVYMADLVLRKPITASVIREKILTLMKELERKQEEQRQLQEQLAQVKLQEQRKHVLVIDDDPMMLKLIKEHLHEKYDVGTAISGKIAHKFLESKKTNLILLDYEMPDENGPEVLRKIRENEKLENIPVLFLTGISDKEKIQQALLLKPQGYLLKPIDKDKLIGTIERFIG